MHDKYKELIEYLKSLGKVAVAYSGGVDSTLLMRAAHDALGDKTAAFTAQLYSVPRRETVEAEDFCRDNGIKQIIIDFDEFTIDGFARNTENRCYFCKKAIFNEMLDRAKKMGFNCVAEGSNTDDDGDYRPGRKAVEELGIISPLRDIRLNKAQIREMSEMLGLKTYRKASFACLATRIPYGECITHEKLDITDKAEQFLFDMGFSQVRVRMHGTVARIEVLPDEICKAADRHEEIYDYLNKLGYTYVSLDLKGYRTGSMNEVL